MAFLFRQGRQHGRLRQRGQTIADAQSHLFRPKPGHQTQRHIAVQGTALRQRKIRIPPLEETPHASQLVTAPLQGVLIGLLSQGRPQGQDLIPQQHRRDGRGMQDHARHPAQLQQGRSIQQGKAARLFGIVPEQGRFGSVFRSGQPVRQRPLLQPGPKTVRSLAQLFTAIIRQPRSAFRQIGLQQALPQDRTAHEDIREKLFVHQASPCLPVSSPSPASRASRAARRRASRRRP